MRVQEFKRVTSLWTKIEPSRDELYNLAWLMADMIHKKYWEGSLRKKIGISMDELYTAAKLATN